MERDFDDRRGWIEDLLIYLAKVFAIDVGNYSVLSNSPHASPALAQPVVIRRQVLLEGEATGERIPQPTPVDPQAIHRAFGSV